MRLILIRHGQTEQNKRKIVQGQGKGTLTPEGLEQARKVAKRLENERIDYIYVSDQQRAVLTAKPLIESHPEAEVHYTPELRERKYGIFEGSPKSEVLRAIQESGKEFHKFKPENGESLEEVQERIKRFYHELIEKHKGKTVVIVSHGALLAAFYIYMFNSSFDEYRKHHPPNTAVTIFEVEDIGKHKVHLLNDISHL